MYLKDTCKLESDDVIYLSLLRQAPPTSAQFFHSLQSVEVRLLMRQQQHVDTMQYMI